jgi:hypothetical protein
MNKNQYIYDSQVQNKNKQTEVGILEKEIISLTDVKNRAYVEGQKDKIRNNRKNTWFEYKQNIEYYEDLIKKKETKLNNMRQKLDETPIITAASTKNIYNIYLKNIQELEIRINSLKLELEKLKITL